MLKIKLLGIFILIGLCLMYIFSPKPDIIIKMPNSQNIYIDTNTGT